MASGTSHTFNYVVNCEHYRNLQTARDKTSHLIFRIDSIITSLETASGTEINKVNSDLLKVKNAFTSLNESISERLNEMTSRALAYDKLYDKLKDLCNQKAKISESTYTTDNGCTVVLLWVRKSDTLHKKEIYFDSIDWESDGYILLIVKTVKTSIPRANQDAFVFSSNYDNMVESPDKKEKTYYDTFRVPYDGKVDFSSAGEGTYWMNN